MTIETEALTYHAEEPAGKIRVEPTKPSVTQHDLSLAYTPGVAAPCREIVKDPEVAFRYTNKGNLVAVVSNGTAVLGLGKIGPLAGKPVMEGKAVLFKRFADIDVFDLELEVEDPDTFIRTVKRLEPTFGGINLEDIKAPECFYIEEQLRREMDIPIFHDDQHGTAIISGAALLNALELVEKEIDQIRIVFNGAGAAAIATARFYLTLGARKQNIVMCDQVGVIHQGRQDLNPYKAQFAIETNLRTPEEAIQGADVFIGLSVGGVLSPEMVRSMADRPIIFAMANPDPEISYEDAKAARRDAIIATGRSDYPNQVNNVLGFPFIFRGALDVRATEINEAMKVAAAHSLAALAQENVPDAVVKAYGGEPIQFGPDYLIPKPLDSRILLWEAPAVANAAIESGVAHRELDLEIYRERLEARLGKSREMMRIIINKAKTRPKRIVFTEGGHPKMIRAAHQLGEERIGTPILLGDPDAIRAKAEELQIDLKTEIIDPTKEHPRERYAERLYQLRRRKGVTRSEAWELITNHTYAAAIMVEQGDADGMISGLTYHYPEALRPLLQVIRTQSDYTIACGVYMITIKNQVLFFADATINIEPSAEQLAEIAILTSELARRFNVEPRVAMLSFSNFGSVRHLRTEKVRRAVEIVKARRPDLAIDGEMQVDTAVVPEILNHTYPFNELKEAANVLIFPDLESGNIGYKLLQRLGNAEVVGPILAGLKKPAYVLQMGDEVKDIVNLASIAVVEAQEQEA
ncbi:MAG: NADP-dependent malic enzyme [Candidatus Bipolaricaulia bacterium]